VDEDFTFDEFLAEYTPGRKRVKIISRGDLVEELEKAKEALDDLRRAKVAGDVPITEADPSEELAERIVDLEAECRRYEREWAFEGIGRKAYRDLVAEHPPTDAQVAKGKDRNLVPEWNEDTFLPALIAASCVKPKGVTVDGLTKLQQLIGWVQWGRLWQAALEANAGDVSVPSYAAAYALLGRSAKSSTTQSR
jgi:hypothetical protein